MASLAEGYCSLITRASQFSSTTRNLVPRFKREVKGEGSGYEILGSVLGLGGSSRRGSSITLMSSVLYSQSVMMKLSSFLRGTPSYLRIGKGQLYNDRML